MSNSTARACAAKSWSRSSARRSKRTPRGERLATLGLGLLGALALARLLATAAAYSTPAWFEEELQPLERLRLLGEPITGIDPRQYGVVVFLVFDPAIRLLGADHPALATYALLVALPAAAVAFGLLARRFTWRPWQALLLGALWCASVPLLYVVAQRMVDAWQLAFVSAALCLFTASSARARRLAGLPLAAATLTKLLPALLLVYLCVRCWRAGLVGLLGVVALLGVGQVAYGPLLGFGYPLAVLGAGGSTVARWSTHFENNSLRGLLFKAAAGFRLRGDTTAYDLPDGWFGPLNLLAYGLAVALVGYLLWVAWIGRGRQGPERRALEFSLAVVTMLLVSPHTAQDYTVMTLPVLTVGLWLAGRGWPRRWRAGQVVLGVAAAVLVGVFVPMNLAARLLPLGWLLQATHTASNPLFGDGPPGIGAYDFFGFPGLGLVCAWLLLAWLERLTAGAPATRPADRARPEPAPAGALG